MFYASQGEVGHFGISKRRIYTLDSFVFYLKHNTVKLRKWKAIVFNSKHQIFSDNPYKQGLFKFGISVSEYSYFN